MIIFDLDGTLSNCEHRRHFVDPSKRDDCYYHFPATLTQSEGWYYKYQFKMCEPPKPMKFIPDWKSFYEDCDKDLPIIPVLDTFIHLTQGEPFNHDVKIWSGRCESVRQKTLKWLVNIIGFGEDYQYWDRRLKMRPIGDSTPDDELKERWLDEYINNIYPALNMNDGNTVFIRNDPIEYVFDDRPKVIRMWRRRGIFVFNCCQHDKEF